MVILNLGCGNKLIPGAVNVDINGPSEKIQKINLCDFPWPWESGSVDGVHASHILEHFPDHGKGFILECHRILARGGFLRLVVPHSSSVSAIGHWGHYRTFSHDTIRRHLEGIGTAKYVFGKLFNTEYQRINWWYEEVDAEGNLSPFLRKFIKFPDKIISWAINKDPRLFENLWWPWVGGAREIVWKGIKI